jgi:hypothetical protein
LWLEDVDISYLEDSHRLLNIHGNRRYIKLGMFTEEMYILVFWRKTIGWSLFWTLPSIVGRSKEAL